MANNLTPEQLAALQAYYAPSNSGWSPAMQSPYQADGQVFQQDGGFIYNYDPNKQQAGQDKFNVFNQDGTFSNEGTFKTDDWQQTLMMALAAAGGMAFLPGGALSSTMGQGSMAAQAGLEGGAGAAGGASGLAGMPGGAAMDVGAFEGLTAADAGLGGVAPAAAGGGGAGLLGGASKWLGPAATLLGAAAGGQGQQTSQTSERKTDPRVDPYLFGNGDQMGLLGMAYNQLSRDQSPERMAQRDQMRSAGMGLLSAPMAGNGFNKFFRG